MLSCDFIVFCIHGNECDIIIVMTSFPIVSLSSLNKIESKSYFFSSKSESFRAVAVLARKLLAFYDFTNHYLIRFGSSYPVPFSFCYRPISIRHISLPPSLRHIIVYYYFLLDLYTNKLAC